MRLIPLLAAALLAALPAAAEAATFKAKRAGEAFLKIRASAPGADWGTAGRESAVLTIRLDGKYNQDVVLFNGATPTDYEVALGPVKKGRHKVTARLNRAKSPRDRARVRRIKATVSRAKGTRALVQKHAPVVYGRDLPEIPGRYENARTDVPLLAYHTVERDPSGNTTIEYTVIWSNEDGGTDTPALMARWGRSTDIEWVYRVTLAPDGDVVTELYQAPDHAELAYTGARLGRHPLLRTATSNNNMLPVTRPRQGYRFFPDARRTLPAGRAREAVMDANPWTYRVMAEEVAREGKVEAVPSPATPEMSDQGAYLFAELDKDTAYPTPAPPGSWVGTALHVKLAGDPTWYSSNHDVADWSIERDIPASTTVELPVGKGPADVEAVKAVAVPVAGDGGLVPADYRITVTSLTKGFFLGDDYLPGASFLRAAPNATLTPAQPEAVLFSRPAG